MNITNLFISLPSQLASLTALKVLADVTLGSANATLDSGTLSANANYIQFIALIGTPSQASVPYVRINSVATDYGYTLSENAGAVATASNTTFVAGASGNAQYPVMIRGEIMDLTGTDKLLIGQTCRALTDSAPEMTEWRGSIDGTDRVTSIQVIASGGTYPAGSRIIVLGV